MIIVVGRRLTRYSHEIVESTAHYFQSRIYQVGILRCVDVPAEVSRALGGERYIPVVVRVGGGSGRSTLVPRGRGRHRLFLKQDLREAAAVDTGDELELAVERDPEPIAPGLPPDLESALNLNPGLLGQFFRETPYQQRAIVTWLEKARRPETRARRIRRIVRMLKSG